MYLMVIKQFSKQELFKTSDLMLKLDMVEQLIFFGQKYREQFEDSLIVGRKWIFRYIILLTLAAVVDKVALALFGGVEDNKRLYM